MRIGLGLGVGARRGGADWTPNLLSGLHTWLIGGEGEIPSTSAVLLDGDCEAAGVGDWTAANDAVLSKAAALVSPGAQSLRIAYDGTASPQALQAILTSGLRYSIAGYAKASPEGRILTAQMGSSVAWTGAASAALQSISGEATADSANFILQSAASGAGEYNDVDNLVLATLSRNQWQDQSGNGHHFSQSVAAQRPWASLENSESVLRVDGSADMLEASTKSDWTFIHNGAGMTIFVAWYQTNATFGHVVDDCRNQNKGIIVSSDTNANEFYFRLLNGAASYTYNGVFGAMPKTTRKVLAARYAEASTPQLLIRREGSTLYSGARTNAPSASDAGFVLHLGCLAGYGGAQFLPGAYREVIAYNRALSDSEFTQVENYISDGWL